MTGDLVQPGLHAERCTPHEALIIMCKRDYTNAQRTEIRISLQSFFYKGDILMANHHFDFLSVTVGEEFIFSTKATMPDDVEMMYYSYRDDVKGRTFLMQQAYSSYTTGYFGLVYDDQTDRFHKLYCEKSFFQDAKWVKGFSSNKVLFASEDNNEIVICRMDSLIKDGDDYLLPVIKAESFTGGYYFYFIISLVSIVHKILSYTYRARSFSRINLLKYSNSYLTQFQ